MSVGAKARWVLHARADGDGVRGASWPCWVMLLFSEVYMLLSVHIFPLFLVCCLDQNADLLMTQLMPLPLTVSCSSKSRLVLPSWFTFLVPAYPGSPGQNPESHRNACLTWTYRENTVWCGQQRCLWTRWRTYLLVSHMFTTLDWDSLPQFS